MASFKSDHLWQALVLSLAVHGVLLASTWRPLPGTGGVSTPLVATLRAARASALPAPAIPAPPSPPHAAFRPAQLPAAVAPAIALAPTTPSIDNSTAQNARRSEPAGAGAATAAVTASSGAVVPSGEDLDAAGLRGYRLALAVQARQFKRYPRQAVEAGWNGTAEVRLAVAAGGLAQAPELLRSSGHAVLDEAAVEMLRQAAPATPVPDSLRSRAFVVSLPVTFDLPD